MRKQENNPTYRCLLVYPKLGSQSFWNDSNKCQLLGVKSANPPLGLLSVNETRSLISGLNFQTIRPRTAVLNDYKKLLKVSLSPERYFGRIQRLCRHLELGSFKARPSIDRVLQTFLVFVRLISKMGIHSYYKRAFWQTAVTCLWVNPRAFRLSLEMMAQYLDLSLQRDYWITTVDQEIERLESTSRHLRKPLSR